MVSAAITSASTSGSESFKMSVKQTKETSTDFSAVFSKSMINNTTTSNKDLSDNSVKMSDKAADSKSDSLLSAKTDDKTVEKNDSATKKLDDSKDAKDVKKVDSKDEKVSTDEVSDEKLDELKKVASKVIDMLKKLFGLSDEDIENAMANLGVGSMELLLSNNLTQLVVQVTDATDALSIVTDSELSDKFMDAVSFLNGMLDDLAKEFNVSGEELQNIVQKGIEELTDKGVAGEMLVDVKDSYVKNDVQELDVVEEESGTDNTMENVLAGKVTVQKNETQSNSFSNSSSDERFLNESSNEIGNENINNGLANMASQITERFEAALEEIDSQINPVDIVNQVVDSIKLESTNELKSMEILLNPQNLGKVNLLVTVREGVVTAQISAENEQVKKALESQLSTLKENIQNQGIKIDAVEVTVQSNAFEANSQQFAQQEQQQESNRTRRRLRLDGFDMSDDEEVEDEVIFGENSSVEYTA